MQHLKKIKDIYFIVIERFWTMIIAVILYDRGFRILSFNTLIAAAKAAGLVDALKGEGPLTVFAPTDDAFAKLPEGTVETLLKPENKEKLKSILLYHVVAGNVMAETAVTLDSAKTLQGSSFSIMLDGKTLKVDGAAVTQADIKASNGVIHVIDSVILPKS